MESGSSSPAMGLFIFWLMLQLVLMMALLVGGIYILYCLSRASAGLDRLASVAEAWMRQQQQQNAAGRPYDPMQQPSPPPSPPQPVPYNTAVAPVEVPSPEINSTIRPL